MIKLLRRAKHRLYLLGAAFRARQERCRKISSYNHFDNELDEKISQLAKELANRRSAKFFFNYRNKSKQAQRFGKFFPCAKAKIIKKADEVISHRFDLLGSGLTDLGTKINWQEDFKVKKCWPLKYYQDLVVTRNDGSDIKVPWELSRFQHFGVLGQAYLSTQNDKYVQEFVDQIDDWIDKNPCPFGPNWRPMEVALRAINWIWGYYFFEDAKELNQEFLVKMTRELIKFGRFIFDNLENRGRITSNHYLSDIVGLLYLGIFLNMIPEARKWRDFAEEELEKEMRNQVFADGVDFEASIPYHRLVAELFISGAHLLSVNRIKLSESFWQRLEKMIEFTAYYTKPNGLAPQIGDADNGRVVVLSASDWRDHRFLLSWGAINFRNSQLAIFEYSPEAWWFFDEAGYKTYQKLARQKTKLISKTFDKGEVTVMRRAQDYMIIDHGRVGQAGNGGHSHNDLFSFELFSDKDIFIDPGSFVYTADIKARDKFRSITYHNNVGIDNIDLNDSVATFKANERAVPQIIHQEINDDYDSLILSHNGYRRLEDPVGHRRNFYFNKKNHVWVIQDILTGKKIHDIKTHFHAGSNQINVRTGNAINIDGIFLRYQLSGKTKVSILKSWFSESYGMKKPGQVIEFFSRAKLPYTATYILAKKRLSEIEIKKVIKEFEKKIKK